MRRLPALTVVVVCLAVTACAGSSDPGTPAPDDDQALGGDREQVTTPGDFPETSVVPLRGTLDRDARGCWTLDIAGTPRIVAMPSGSRTSEDRGSWITPDGEVLSDGQAVDVEGAIVVASSTPDVPDGYWGNLLAYCEPRAPEFVVIDSAGPSFDPATVTDEQWSASLAGVALSIDHGCGYGFASTSADRRVALQLSTPARPDDRSPVALPADGWTATVTVGKDLLVDNCDDVAEQWETQPLPHRTWPVVAGTLVVDGTGPLPECDGEPVSASLLDAAVRTPTGVVRLGDVDLVNDAYGCFAG